MHPPPLALRQSVATFAKAMEEKLRENDYKGGWKGSCIPKKNLHYAIGLLPKPSEGGGLFPEFT